MARPSRNRNKTPAPTISTKELSLLEDALSGLPGGPVTDGDSYAQADSLLKFGYHQNPYMRMFTKVLWSGYAISRGRIVECDQRFKQAHRDAQISNIDKITIRALDDAAGALEQALAPDGSVGAFLGEMRNRTLRRMWSRVCETSHLPPPSFSKIFGSSGEMTLEEMEAADAAEMAALMKEPEPEEVPEGAEDAPVAEAAGDDGEAPEAAAPADEAAGSDSAGDDAADAPAADGGDDVGAPPPLPMAAQSSDDDADDNDEPRAEAAATDFTVEVGREGSVDLGPELLLSAASEALKELRIRRPEGGLKITISVVGQGRGRSRGRRGRRRRK